MSTWKHLIRFEATDSQVYTSSLPVVKEESELVESTVRGFASFADLLNGSSGKSVFGELTIATSKDARDVSVEEASNYILGYTVGTDLTARSYQDPKRGGGQFTRCKAFDGFAPLGPVLTTAEAFGDLEGHRIITKVNGKVFQDSACLRPDPWISSFDELPLSGRTIGTTLPAGTVIMMGSPPGTGYFQNPKCKLKNGDVAKVGVSSIGTLRNTMVFE
ncbi:hypothetical protein B0J15DRAFT_530733 [Fusarium solani]|uniref:Fumarylacetoacetase-like C-terminal domain-containing protein n=1 Tax=Fusarium solani TaxID=169388 RepID=A0A9P9G2Z4_FUSSL|nr:uncharacterized protein B0J15DRAFT_530733 [Fusarium solani]KAH7230302.1 hypothetical protein B0J15DRAFT_530733 [Fusarium solani]